MLRSLLLLTSFTFLLYEGKINRGTFLHISLLFHTMAILAHLLVLSHMSLIGIGQNVQEIEERGRTPPWLLLLLLRWVTLVRRGAQARPSPIYRETLCLAHDNLSLDCASAEKSGGLWRATQHGRSSHAWVTIICHPCLF